VNHEQKEFDMQKMATIGVAFGILLIAAVPLQAAHHSTKKHLRHAHVSLRARPPAAAPVVAANTPKFCYYLGGPHGTTWVCRQ
jgi:hypothetical protein